MKRRGIIFNVCVSAAGTVNLVLHSTAFQSTSNIVNSRRFLLQQRNSFIKENRLVASSNKIQLNELCNDFDDCLSSFQPFKVANQNSSIHVGPKVSKLELFVSLFKSKTSNHFKNMSIKIRKIVITFMFAITMMTSTAAFAAVTGGRVGGGSFKTRTSSSISRPSSRSYSPSTPRKYYSGPSVLPLPRIIYYHQPSSPIVIHQFSGAPIMSPYTASAIKDVLLLTGTGTLIAYALAKNAYRNREPDDMFGISAGGATIASITVCLDVPNKNDPNSILYTLQKIASSSNTLSNRGLKDLVTAVTIELTRQEASIRSAVGKANFYRIIGQAEREFRVLSVQGQSKVDRLTFNKFGSENQADNEVITTSSISSDGPTQAIVTLNVGLQGNFVGRTPLKVSDRQLLLDLLTRIGADVQLEESKLLAAEVLWSPEGEEVLSMGEILEKYPELMPL